MPAAARILTVNGPGTLVPGPFTLRLLLRWLTCELEGLLCRLASHLGLCVPAAVGEQTCLGQGQGERGVSRRVAQLDSALSLRLLIVSHAWW